MEFSFSGNFDWKLKKILELSKKHRQKPINTHKSQTSHKRPPQTTLCPFEVYVGFPCFMEGKNLRSIKFWTFINVYIQLENKLKISIPATKENESALLSKNFVEIERGLNLGHQKRKLYPLHQPSNPDLMDWLVIVANSKKGVSQALPFLLITFGCVHRLFSSGVSVASTNWFAILALLVTPKKTKDKPITQHWVLYVKFSATFFGQPWLTWKDVFLAQGLIHED